MILGNQVEWALHCCALLAMQTPDRFLSTKDLATFHGVPKEYLSKALQALSNANILEASLGPSGGYRLKMKAAELSFLKIVEAVEGKRSTFSCTDIKNNNPCLKKTVPGLCGIAKVMYRADQAWRDQLQSMTIQTLVEQLKTQLPQELQNKNAAWFGSD